MSSVTDGQTYEQTTAPYPSPCTRFTLWTPSMHILLYVHVEPPFCIYTKLYFPCCQCDKNARKCNFASGVKLCLQFEYNIAHLYVIVHYTCDSLKVMVLLMRRRGMPTRGSRKRLKLFQRVRSGIPAENCFGAFSA